MSINGNELQLVSISGRIGGISVNLWPHWGGLVSISGNAWQLVSISGN